MADVALSTSIPRTRPLVSSRVAGLAGLAFAVSVAIQNIWSQATRLMADLAAPASMILEKVTQNAEAYGVLFAWVAVNIVVFVIFLAGAIARFKEAAPSHANLALVGGVLLGVFFPLSNLPVIAMVTSGNALAGSLPLVDVLWDLHLAAFAFAGIALGVTMFGLSQCAAKEGLVPTWLCWLAVLGSAVLTAASIPVQVVAQGSVITYVGLLGFGIWLAFLGTLGVNMWRETD